MCRIGREGSKMEEEKKVLARLSASTHSPPVEPNTWHFSLTPSPSCALLQKDFTSALRVAETKSLSRASGRGWQCVCERESANNSESD